MIDSIAQQPMLAALIALVSLGMVFGALLGFAAEKFKVQGDPIVEQIDNLLPQTQCGQCGFPGCRPYAQ
ncbi:MAG: electron transport complex protein RnfB, partial [Porticoccaceae bacterium]